MGVLVIVMSFALSKLDNMPVGYAQDMATTVWIGVFFLAVAYKTHLKIRHVESINYHRSIESQRPQT